VRLEDTMTVIDYVVQGVLDKPRECFDFNDEHRV
jgi:hypothetical protein